MTTREIAEQITEKLCAPMIEQGLVELSEVRKAATLVESALNTERERCAKIAEDQCSGFIIVHGSVVALSSQIATAIREGD